MCAERWSDISGADGAIDGGSRSRKGDIAPLGLDRYPAQLRMTRKTEHVVRLSEGALCETHDALTRIVATTLAVETVNGMAKTAPMIAAAMAKMLEAVKSKG